MLYQNVYLMSLLGLCQSSSFIQYKNYKKLPKITMLDSRICFFFLSLVCCFLSLSY
ncbi:hypothetical protein HC081234_08340 [Helicobacter cinaedi]|nr:hypothetical protein HC081234_08340 [Helicobacter cinaedi]